MTLTRYEKLMKRFRIWMTESGVLRKGAPEKELYNMLVGETHEQKMHSLEMVLKLVPERYWQAREGGMPSAFDLSHD